ncbi:MAG TPA: SpoIIE family protein phosphatase [Thermoleophilaceae bacterium]
MSPHRRTSVLLVDDQPENLLALEAVLKPLGLNTVRATSGEHALRRLLDEDFAAILLDVQMPNMDGFETAEFIKQRERTQHIPIIFLTAIDKERQQVFRGYSVGAVDYLFKPFDPDVLRSKVQIFVDLYEKNAALKESEERFRTAFANAPIGIGLIDIDGRWLEVNRALSQLLGYSPGELVGKMPWELSHPEDRAEERKGFQRIVRGEARSFAAEKRYLHKDGHVVYVLLSVSLAHDADGEPRGGIWQVVDITERRQAEAERAERMREQAARAEAEAVADTIQKIQRVTDAALEHLAMDDLLRELASHIADILQVDSATIFLLEQGEDYLTVGATVGLGVSEDGTLQVPVGETFAGTVATGREPVVLHDVAAAALQDPLLEGKDVCAMLGVPLVVEGRVSGVIQVASVSERRFTREDESLLQLVADRAALAVEHARLYARELGIVETLQRSLLPESLPQVPGLLTAARYMPGGPGADVGGDWYDAISLDGGRLGIAMGDVVGHGIGAAALMGQLRNALRAYALDGNSPAQVVEKLDRLVQNLEAGRMATLVYMVIAPDLGSVEFSSAGHLPPLVLGPDGKAVYLEGGRTLPLGVMPSAEYPQADAELEPGSTIVLYTDGLVEERGASIDRGLEALMGAVADGPTEPEALCDHIVSLLLADRPATDDIAVLTVRTEPLSPERLHLDLPTNPKSLGTLRRTVGRWLEPLGASTVESNDIQVSCHEACSNAMEHGYRFREATIDVNAEFDGSEVVLTVADTGGWREQRDSDRGRGLDLIRALMDSVEVEPGAEGTVVRMRKRLAEPVAMPGDLGVAERAG